ncbi:MAG: hypothetical protein ABSE90_02415 [Verrucomicrobiota bacterium]|jgi:hypothetical protein
MNEEPKSIWKKSFTGWGWLWAWFWTCLILLAAIFIILLIVVQFIPDGPKHFFSMLPGVCIYSLVVSTGVIALFAFAKGFVYCCRHFKRFLFGLACLITLIALFYAEEDWRGWHAWNQFKHQWEAKGDKFGWQSIVPAPVSGDQNFAFSPVWIAEIKSNFLYNPKHAEAWYGQRIYSEEVFKFLPLVPVSVSGLAGGDWGHNLPEESGNWAAARTTDLKPWQTYYRDLGKTNPAANIPVAAQPQSPAADVLLALSKYDPVIDQLRKDSARPYSRFPIGYDDENKASILLPHLAVVKRYSKVLQLRAIAELQNGESDKALGDVKLSLRLVDSIRTEPIVISHLVCIAMLQITLQPVYEGLAAHQWSDAQLAGLDAELAELDFLSDCQNVQKSEIFFSAEEVNFLRRHRDYAADFAQMGIRYPGDVQFQFAIYHYMPSGWFYQSALKNGLAFMQYLPAVNHDTRTTSPTLIRRADAAATNAISFFDPLDTLNKMFNADFLFMGNFLKEIAYGQSSVDLARTAITLERYRLAHGEYPASLAVLAPQFIEKVPHDVIGGQPLKYRREADGQFVLYSVGWNERDDGGVIVLQKGSTPTVNRDEGDWVWRYPQK